MEDRSFQTEEPTIIGGLRALVLGLWHRSNRFAAVATGLSIITACIITLAQIHVSNLDPWAEIFIIGVVFLLNAHALRVFWKLGRRYWKLQPQIAFVVIAVMLSVAAGYYWCNGGREVVFSVNADQVVMSDSSSANVHAVAAVDRMLQTGEAKLFIDQIIQQAAKYDALFESCAARYVVDVNALKALALTENSDQDPNLVTADDGIGLLSVQRFQFSDNENPFDPRTNICTGARVLRESFNATRSWVAASAAYNAGHAGTEEKRRLAGLLDNNDFFVSLPLFGSTTRNHIDRFHGRWQLLGFFNETGGIPANKIEFIAWLDEGAKELLNSSTKYVVTPGDSLSQIAEQAGFYYHCLQKIVENPDSLTIGQELMLPKECQLNPYSEKG